MRILVTGASGFIGTPLTGLAFDGGNEVLGMDMVPPREGRVGHQTTDIRDEAAVRRVMSDFRPETVVHLAALHYIPYCNDHPDETVATNVAGTRNVLLASQESGVRRVVFASTAAVYRPSDEAHGEEAEVCPIDIYGLTKAFGEDLAKGLSSRDVEVVTARIFNVYGPGDPNPHVIPEIIDQLRPQLRNRSDSAQLSLGNLSPARDYVHVSDVAKALYVLLQTSSTSNIFNIGSGIATSVLNLVEVFQELLGVPLEIEQSEGRIRPLDRPHLRADAARLRAEGWLPTTDLRSGLRALLD